MESGKVVAGKYRLNQLLGSGGMAEVWSATNTFTERQLAIKFMNTQVAKTPEAAARFLKEAKVSARINHPNIIEIHDVGQTDQGQLFLVMELLTGFPLEVALRRQNPPMTLYEFAIVMVEVGDALAAAHKSGIVHRDLKPTNIFLHKPQTGTPMPKLLDFGVSKFLEDDQNHALTIAGTVLGSPLYMSPEQARGDGHLDGRTDVFAFGAILFEALCGYRAYEAKNFNALIVKIATTKPKSIDDCAPHVPASLRAIVRGCLEVDLKKRLQTFEEITSHMRTALPELEASPLRLPTPLIATSVVDPDATNALPVLRASDRPPPAAHYTPGHGFTPPTGNRPPGAIPPPQPLSITGERSGSVPPYPSSGPTGPSWHTPNTSYASITVSAPRPRSTAWIAIGAVALGVIALGAGVGLGWKGRGAGNSASAGSSLAKPGDTSKANAPPPQATALPAAAPTSNEPPSISVDSLPGTNASAKAAGPVPRGAGRLLVTAAPGWCNLTVDGKERGPTPVAGLDLPAGAHQLRCDAPGGKVKTTSVTIQDGATSRIKIALDD
ncbi:MAG: Serine/threonine protein kinase [Labilithrix sp.]|nr:Serine/threonine protein kinase [Labilithrix sp.]